MSLTSHTCRFGSGEDKLCSTAALHLAVAGVNVDAVDGERLQAEDLQLPLCHRLLHEIKFTLCWLLLRCAAVSSSVEGGGRAAVGLKTRAACEGGVGDAEHISTPTVWRPWMRERSKQMVKMSQRRSEDEACFMDFMTFVSSH